MKLKDYLKTMPEDDLLTCWDSVYDSEFYLWGVKPDPTDENVAYDLYIEYLVENLDILEIHRDGVVVNLYDLLMKPSVVEYAKKEMYDLEEDFEEDFEEIFFYDNVVNIGSGYPGFSKEMLEAFGRN